MSEFSFPNLPHRKRSCLFGPEAQNLNQIETICYHLSTRPIRERYQKGWFRFQNDIGAFVLWFLALLVSSELLALKMSASPHQISRAVSIARLTINGRFTLRLAFSF